jgi:hypothetical protein
LFFYDARDRERFAVPASPEEVPPLRPRRRYARRVAANRSLRRAQRMERRAWRAWLARRDGGQDPGPLPPLPMLRLRDG